MILAWCGKIGWGREEKGREGRGREVRLG